MSSTRAAHRVAPLSLVLLAVVACADRGRELPAEPRFHVLGSNEWTEPVNLGAPVNSAGNEFNPSLSPDGLSLYFNTPNRPGGLGQGDIWVARRECTGCPWGEPRNLHVINTMFGEGGPSISIDGHLLFFGSNRPGTLGNTDLWASRREDVHDDFAWGPPVNLGPGVNTAEADGNADYVPAGSASDGNLYFQRGVPMQLTVDIYVARITPDGEVVTPARLVSELSLVGANDGGPTLSMDGRELIFWSFGPPRPGLGAGGDLFVTTRQSPRHAWSAPRLLPIPPNHTEGAIMPALSSDGNTLFFVSARSDPTAQGGLDIWMTTRIRRGME